MPLPSSSMHSLPPPLVPPHPNNLYSLSHLQLRATASTHSLTLQLCSTTLSSRTTLVCASLLPASPRSRPSPLLLGSLDSLRSPCLHSHTLPQPRACTTKPALEHVTAPTPIAARTSLALSVSHDFPLPGAGGPPGLCPLPQATDSSPQPSRATTHSPSPLAESRAIPFPLLPRLGKSIANEQARPRLERLRASLLPAPWRRRLVSRRALSSSRDPESFLTSSGPHHGKGTSATIASHCVSQALHFTCASLMLPHSRPLAPVLPSLWLLALVRSLVRSLARVISVSKI